MIRPVGLRYQVQPDWNATVGKGVILNKPSIPAAQVPADWSASSGVARILNKPTLFSGAYADLTGKPTLFSGSYLDLTNKPTIPTVKRIEAYTGTTDANGLYTVTYPVAFAAIPNVQPEPPSAANYTWIKVSSTITGFSLRLIQRASLTVLGLELLAAAFTNVPAVAARVLVVES